MTKFKLSLLVATALIGLSACEKSAEKPAANSSASTEAATATPADSAQPAATAGIDTAGWVETDLSKTAPMIRLKVALPKTATLEANGNGGVDVTIAEGYKMTVSILAVSSIKSTLTEDKDYVLKHESHKTSSIVSEDKSGFVYTYTLKDEENGTKYEPVWGFYSYVEKNQEVWGFQLDDTFSEASLLTLDNAQKVYAKIKQSAKINP